MIFPITNALTIDVEDYFQVSAFAPHIARSEWDTRECRVERNINIILEMLANHSTKATFFTLGWIAERYPQLIRQIVAQGHELASHGYGHERASDMTEDAFFADVNLAKVILEDLADTEVRGYRAPSFSIGTGNLWAFDCLARAGYRYSSSIYPISHDHYGMPNAPRFAHPVRFVLGGVISLPVVADTSVCCPMPCRAGCWAALTRATARLAFFIFTLGKLTPTNPVLMALAAKRAFGTTSTLIAWKPA